MQTSDAMRREIAKPHPFQAREIALSALADFAGLPCNQNFCYAPLGIFMQTALTHRNV